jgi:hypothetical protein
VTSPRRECDLVARGYLDGLRSSALMDDRGVYTDTDGRRIDAADLRAMARAPGNGLTYTCTPPGNGRRIALDLQ